MIFQHSSLTYCIPLVKNQSSFYETRSLTVCIKIKTFDWVNWKQLNILIKFSGYLEFYVEDDTEDDSALTVALQITFRGLVACEPVVYKKKVYFEKNL